MSSFILQLFFELYCDKMKEHRWWNLDLKRLPKNANTTAIHTSVAFQLIKKVKDDIRSQTEINNVYYMTSRVKNDNPLVDCIIQITWRPQKRRGFLLRNFDVLVQRSLIKCNFSVIWWMESCKFVLLYYWIYKIRWGKPIRCSAEPRILSFPPTRSINLIIHE